MTKLQWLISYMYLIFIFNNLYVFKYIKKSTAEEILPYAFIS